MHCRRGGYLELSLCEQGDGSQEYELWLSVVRPVPSVSANTRHKYAIRISFLPKCGV